MSESPNVFVFPQAATGAYTDLADRLEQAERGGAVDDDLDVPEWMKQDQEQRRAARLAVVDVDDELAAIDTSDPAALRGAMGLAAIPAQVSRSEEVQYRSNAVTQPETPATTVQTAVVEEDQDDEDGQEREKKRGYFHKVRVVVGHKHTRTVARQGAYVVAGTAHARKRWRDERTTARHHRMMTAAETTGDHATALLWEERASKHRAEKHARRMELLKHGPLHLARSLAISGLVAAGTLILLGIILASSSKHVADVIRPLMDAATFIRFVAQVIGVLFWPAVALAPIGVLASLWSLGRRRAEVPAWLAPQGQKQAPGNTKITPSVVIVALRDLGLTELRKKIKEMEDGAAALLGPIAVAGVGVEVDVYLPSGVSTTDILDRHQKLAENLGRHRHELYMTVPAERARTVRLWIADIGALNEPIDPSPLVTDPDIVANWFTGAAPWGVDLRRDPVGFRPKQRHMVLTGLSNHGKTFALRALALWCAFDVCVEFLVADLKGVGDWSMYDGLATELIEGPGDRHVIATTYMVEGAVAEMERRLEEANKLGLKDGIPEELARKPGSGFHPIIVIVDEAQRAIICPAVDSDKKPFGGLTNKGRFLTACRNLMNQGRAVNIVLWLGTQDPNPQNFPVLLRNSAHLRASLPLGSKGQSEMVLGEDAVAAGAAPHRLRRGIDKGVVVGFGEGLDFPAGQSHMTVWTHFVDGEDAHVVADRAKKRRKAVTTNTGRADDQDELPELDVLADVAAVLDGAPRMLKTEVMHLLAERDDRYRTWTDGQMKAALETEGAPQYTSNGKTTINGDKVREVLARRFSATDQSEM